MESELSTLPDSESQYGYRPTRYVCYLFIVLFSLSSFLHLAASIRYKMWWILATFVGCSLGETLGWAGRLWSSYNLEEFIGFQIQITCTIIAPTFTLAGIFVILGQVMTRLGIAYSRFSSRLYTWVFVTCDVIALIVQAAGGGIASGDDPILGGTIMLGGISFQLAVLTISTIVALEFFVRFFMDKPFRTIYGDDEKAVVPAPRGDADKKIIMMIGTMALIILLLFIRAVYRTIELSDGWSGRIITTEVYFNVLDGMMIVLVQYLLLFCHPGYLLGEWQTTVTIPEPRKRTVFNSSSTVV